MASVMLLGTPHPVSLAACPLAHFGAGCGAVSCRAHTAHTLPTYLLHLCMYYGGSMEGVIGRLTQGGHMDGYTPIPMS